MLVRLVQRTASRLICVMQRVVLFICPRHTASRWGSVTSPLLFLHRLTPVDSPLTLAPLPVCGCQQLVMMEPTVVTHQPFFLGSRFKEKEDGGLPAGSSANGRSNSAPFASVVALTQPGLGVTTTTITTITQTGGTWSTGLLDFDADTSTCVVGAVAPCCLDLSLAHQYGESVCLPLLPGSTVAMRVALRERYKIQGNICDDWTAVCCCYSLALCQMVRESKQRTTTRTYHVSTALESS
ncbi:uncharacterized protein [Nerophis lumbriciformis]|uniref:uncharacterized protein n=1 Tax=Nerophis lumbriciformis TaxID=546530 RepID=UPI002AE02264|nr:uncharacterized protein LOC133607693 [Nerophis lumbriciformis]